MNPRPPPRCFASIFVRPGISRRLEGGADFRKFYQSAKPRGLSRQNLIWNQNISPMITYGAMNRQKASAKTLRKVKLPFVLTHGYAQQRSE
jgi:hypothetical protein